MINIRNKEIYIKNIKKNITIAKEIKKIAIKEKVDYQTAKIMYNNGRNNISKSSAEKIIKNIPKKSIIPELINELNKINIELQDEELELDDVYIKIANRINKDIINELDRYIFAKKNYGELIYSIMTLGCSLKEAINRFEKIVEKEQKNNGLSEIAAICKVLYFDTDIEAIEFEKAYKNKTAIEQKPEITVKKMLFASNEYPKTNINGITLISKTKEGLQKLEDFVGNAYNIGNKEYLSILSNKAQKHGLFIIDFQLTCSGLSHYHNAYKYIYFDSKSVNKNEDFFHETTHFLDNVIQEEIDKVNDSYYSVKNEIVINIIEKIKSKISIVPKGVSLSYFNFISSVKYVNDEKLNQKWLKEIKQNNPTANKENIELYMQQKKLYERKKYKILSKSLMDILDGITKGKLYNFGISGHGKEYYSSSENQFVEFIADIGVIYNQNGADFLNFELGEEITTEIMNMYNDFLNISQEDNYLSTELEYEKAESNGKVR